jgi:hypothetical protein
MPENTKDGTAISASSRDTASVWRHHSAHHVRSVPLRLRRYIGVRCSVTNASTLGLGRVVQRGSSGVVGACAQLGEPIGVEQLVDGRHGQPVQAPHRRADRVLHLRVDVDERIDCGRRRRHRISGARRVALGLPHVVAHKASATSSEWLAVAVVASATGSCARMDARMRAASGPCIQGTRRTSVGRAPDAKTTVRPAGSAVRSAASRTSSRRSARLVDRRRARATPMSL